MTHEQDSPYPSSEQAVEAIEFHIDEFLRGGQNADSLPVLDAAMNHVEAPGIVSTIVTDKDDHFWQLAAYVWNDGESGVPIRLMRRLLYNSNYKGTIVAEFTDGRPEAIISPAYSHRYVIRQIGRVAVQEKIADAVQTVDDPETLSGILGTVQGMRFAKDDQVRKALRIEGRQVRRLLQRQNGSECAGMFGWIAQ